MSTKRQPIIFVSLTDWMDEQTDVPDDTLEPYAVLRAKSELLAEFLGCTDGEAERLILERITSLE